MRHKKPPVNDKLDRRSAVSVHSDLETLYLAFILDLKEATGEGDSCDSETPTQVVIDTNPNDDSE